VLICSLLPFALSKNNPQLTLKLIGLQAYPLKCATKSAALSDAFRQPLLPVRLCAAL